MKRCLTVLSLLTGAAFLAGCGGDGGGGSATPTQPPTTPNAGSAVSKSVAQSVMASSLSGAAQAMSGNVTVPRMRAASDKATVSIQSDENSAHAVVTFNDPIAVQGGSATLTGTLTMDILISGSQFTADVDLDITATYNNAVLACDDGNHTVNGQFRISGPMDMTSSGSSVSATWTWTMTSTDLTIDGVAYDIDLTYNGSVNYPGSGQATLTGTINGVPVSETVTVTVTN